MNLSFIKNLSQEKQNEINSLDIIPKGRASFEVGDVYNHLTILGRAKNAEKYRNTYVYAICDCEEHNIIRVQLNQLKTNHTVSCGCVHKHLAQNLGKTSYIDMTDKIIGSFKVKEKTKERDYESVIWMCECIYCGNKRKISQRNMKNNILHPNICNCQLKYGSSYEQIIKNILDSNNIFYYREYSFDNFVYNDTGRKPRYDFYLPDYKCLIEVNGAQHYKEVSSSFGKYSLQDIQNKDKIKIKYALDNNYSIIIIPYWNINIIEYKDLLPGSKFELKEAVI